MKSNFPQISRDLPSRDRSRLDPASIALSESSLHQTLKRNTKGVGDFRNFSPSHANRALGEKCCQRFYDCTGSRGCLVSLFPLLMLYQTVYSCIFAFSCVRGCSSVCIEQQQKRETAYTRIWSRCTGTALIFSARSSNDVREYASSVTRTRIACSIFGYVDEKRTDA